MLMTRISYDATLTKPQSINKDASIVIEEHHNNMKDDSSLLIID